MNRKRNLFRIVMITICVIFCINNIVLGLSGSDLTGKFDGKTQVSDSDIEEGEGLLTNVLGPILSVIRIVAIGIAIIMITILGIKYMTAAPSEKANIKNQLITFTIGAVIVIGTTSILSMIRNAINSITAAP